MYHKKKKKQYLITILLFLLFFFFLFLSLKRMIYLETFFTDLFYSSNSNKEELSISVNEELQLELEEAKSLLKLKNTLRDFTMESAMVVRHNLSYWWEEVLINKGTKDGIKEGMAVVSGNGLVGRITKCNLNTASVQLLTSPMLENQVSIKIKINDKKYVFGILKNEKGKLMIEGMDKDIPFKKGMEVITSGLSDVFPSGILIGNIKTIGMDHYHVGQVLEVELSSNLEMLTMVGVLKGNRE